MVKNRSELIVLNDDDIMAPDWMDGPGILSRLLYTFLKVWNAEICGIDIDAKADEILRLLDEDRAEAEPDDCEEEPEKLSPDECAAMLLIKLRDDLDGKA